MQEKQEKLKVAVQALSKEIGLHKAELNNKMKELHKEVEGLKTAEKKNGTELSSLKKEVLELKTGLSGEVCSLRLGLTDMNKTLRTELDTVNKGIDEFDVKLLDMK